MFYVVLVDRSGSIVSKYFGGNAEWFFKLFMEGAIYEVRFATVTAAKYMCCLRWSTSLRFASLHALKYLFICTYIRVFLCSIDFNTSKTDLAGRVWPNRWNLSFNRFSNYSSLQNLILSAQIPIGMLWELLLNFLSLRVYIYIFGIYIRRSLKNIYRG